MVVDQLLAIAVALVDPLLSMFSWSAPPAQDVSGMAIIGSALGTANQYLPVGLFLTLILAGFVFDLSLTGARALVWVWQLLPFKAS